MRIDLHHHYHPQKGSRIVFGFKIGKPVLRGRSFHMPLDLTITNEQKVQVTVNPVTQTGKPAKLDGPIAVSVVSGAGTVQQIDDLSVFLISPDDPGDTTFLVDGDADLGAGREDVQDTIVLHTLGANAANLGLSAAAPVAK